MGTRRFKLLAACASVAVFAPVLHAAVIINEVQYDDGGTDDREFIELYNSGGSPVDISGWVISGRDIVGNTNPTATIPASTSLAAGGYYVLGNTGVANVNQTVVANFLENAAETVELRSTAGGTLQDAFLYASWNGPTKATDGYGALPADVQAEVGPAGNSPGYWGRFQSNDVAVAANTNTFVTLSRYQDGLDTNNNGRDFGIRPATPGASNTTGVLIVPTFTPADVDAAATETDVPGLRGAFVNPKVVNPLVQSASNTTTIPASPQGGNVISVIDTSGGGNAAVSIDLHQGAGTFNIDAYLDTTDLTTATWHETTMYGTLGQIDTFANAPDIEGDILATVPAGNFSGVTGVAWIYQKFGSRATLYLVDAGDGGNSSPDVAPVEWSILQEIDMSSASSAWHRLAISVDATGSGFALLDGASYPITTAANLTGGFYVGYREVLGAGNPTTPGAGEVYHPARFDISTSPIPEPTSLALLGLGAAVAVRRRKP